MGATLDAQSRTKFNILFRALLENKFPNKVSRSFKIPIELCSSPKKSYINFPPKEYSVFDYRYILEGQGKGEWKLWSDYVTEAPPIPQGIPFNDILVPTIDVIRHQVIMSILITHHLPMMTVGKTGTGKSTYTMVINTLKNICIFIQIYSLMLCIYYYFRITYSKKLIKLYISHRLSISQRTHQLI